MGESFSEPFWQAQMVFYCTNRCHDSKENLFKAFLMDIAREYEPKARE
jgi:hypothetical protein